MKIIENSLKLYNTQANFINLINRSLTVLKLFLYYCLMTDNVVEQYEKDNMICFVYFDINRLSLHRLTTILAILHE